MSLSCVGSCRFAGLFFCPFCHFGRFDCIRIPLMRGFSEGSELLADLGITKTHSRPHTSDDNPYSEAQFKTLKYRPDFLDLVSDV